VNRTTPSRITSHGTVRSRELVGQSIYHREDIEFLAMTYVDEVQAGTWTKKDGDIVVVCPCCAKRILIGEEYQIKANGLVYPSVFCTSAECQFDYYVLLKGFNALGNFTRAFEKANGVLLYAMTYERLMIKDGKEVWVMQPPEYTHAIDAATARMTFANLLGKDDRMIGIAPSIDPHVAGASDPSKSILAL